MLLQFNADPNSIHEARGNTVAHVAAGSGFAEVLRILLQNGADPEARNTWGDTVIKVAKKQKKAGKPGSDEIMAVLAEFGLVDPPAPG
mmetsp:Transcript_8877/g.18731  ORF Transcript_8877/g.18731 Transcript_8877/m.18731 type:complete len:88 (-) Transcript_8877:102-365(-)